MNKISDRCHVCNGKPRGLCPAMGKAICSRCCGSKRGTKIPCVSECSYSPFSVKGYDLWLKIDANLTSKILKYVIDAYGKDRFEKMMEHMSFESDHPNHRQDTAAGSALYYLLFVEPIRDGRVLAHYWKESGWEGLSNDERAMMNCRLSSRAAVIEIQKILDNQTMECLDLFDAAKGPFVLIDRSTASRVLRFTRIFTWLTHYPNFSRTENNGVEIPDLIFEEFMDVTRESFKKEYKGKPRFPIKDYLSANVGAFCELAHKLSRDKHLAMLNKIDMHQCKAFYKIEGDFKKVKGMLDTYPDFQAREKHSDKKPVEGAFYYSWLRKGKSKALENKMIPAFRHDDESQGVGAIGNVTLLADKLIIEVFTKQKFAFAKKMIKRYFKENLTLQNELVVDMAKQLAGKINSGEDIWDKPKGPAEQSPLPVDVERQITQKFFKDRYEKFMDEEIPMLDNLTPRQASKDLKMRPRLIDLMKLHLKGIEKQNRTKDLGLNLGWILDELNLKELL